MYKLLIKLSLFAFLVPFSLMSQVIHLSENFDSSTLPTGWNNNAISGTQTWNFGSNTGNNIDGTAMAYFDDDVLGNSSLNNTVELISPSFDNSSFPSTTLSFDFNFRQLNTPADSFYVEVFDGTSWNTVFSRDFSDCGSWTASACTNNFPTAVIDISSYANTNCQVRFIYHDGNDWCWYVGIDNVLISSPYHNDIGITEVINPFSKCNLSTTETIQVKIMNFGTSATSTPFDVTVDINNGSQTYTETIASSILQGDSLIYTFSSTANLQSTGFYDITTYTSYSIDEDHLNDTMIAKVENEPVFQPNYSDDFEGFNRWKVSGINPSWELGSPSGMRIDTAVSGTKAYVTNLSGIYNSSEVSYLTSPCFDLSQGNGIPILEFNLIYYTEISYDSLNFEATIDGGITWQTVNSGQLARNWYSQGNSWQGNSGGWVSVENTLDALNGNSDVQFRFRFESDGGVNQEGIGIDNFSIRYSEAHNIELREIIYPSTTTTPLCGLGFEHIVLEIENDGFNTIDTTYLSYQVNNGLIVTDTFISPILPHANLNYTFQTPYDFSIPGSYSIDTWVKTPRDTFPVNDSVLNYTVNGTSSNGVSIPFSENFNANYWVTSNSLSNGWTRSPSNSASYTWRVGTNYTPAFNTGPASGNGGTGNYLYASSGGGNSGNIAVLESPCFDLLGSNGGILEYWYHRYGTNTVPIHLDIYDGIQWHNDFDVNNSTPQTHSNAPWKKRTVNLNQFAQRKIKIRFRTTKSGFGGGDMAIDDISIVNPQNIDVQINSFISPTSGCLPEDSIRIEVENLGITSISNLPLSYQIDNGTIIQDTLKMTILPASKAVFTFSQTGSFITQNKTYQTKAWASLVNDTNSTNDTIKSAIRNTVQSSYFKDDFESLIDGYCNRSSPASSDFLDLWRETSTSNYQWNVHDVAKCGSGTASGGTGPDKDHTYNNVGVGKFLYTEASGVSGVAQITSPCIDFTTDTTAALEFWYHKFGASAADLYVDVFFNGSWVNGIDTIIGQTHRRSSAPWLKRVVNLDSFTGQIIQLRFRTSNFTGPGVSSDIAIDDVQIYIPSSQDIEVNEIVSPQSACFLSNNEIVSVRISNFGTQRILPGAATMNYQLNNGVVVSEQLLDTLEIDSTTLFTFSQSVNLSAYQTSNNLLVYATLNGDNTLFNNEKTKNIFNNSYTLPYSESFENINDSICFNSSTKDLQALPRSWNNARYYQWFVQNDTTCYVDSIQGATFYNLTGPASAHDGNGFLFFNRMGPDTTNTSFLQLPCFDFINQSSVRMEFWYHRYGIDMWDFFIEVIDQNGNVTVVDSIVGQTHSYGSAPWSQKIVNLDSFANQKVSIRFRTSQPPLTFLYRSDMAIDQLSIYNPLTVDVSDVANSELNTFSLYPNPNTGNFKLQVSKAYVGNSYSILNLKGQKIQEGSIQKEIQEVELQNQEKGIYLLRVNESGNTLKFVVM